MLKDYKKLFLVMSIFLVLTSLVSGQYGLNAQPRITQIQSVTVTGTGNVSTFLGLTDTPNSYSGESGDCVVVNGAENALEFASCSNSSGDITAVVVTAPYLLGGASSGSATIDFNETKLNSTIALIAATFAGGNSSFNQSYANTLYYSITNPLNFINHTQATIYNDTTLILSVNSTFTPLLGQNCPAGQVVNGTLSNGTFRCTTVSSSSVNFGNVSFTNQSQTWDADQNISLGLRGWFFGRFFWTAVSNYLTFNGTTLTLNDAQLNTNFNSTGRIDAVNLTLTNLAAVGCPAGNYTYDIQPNGTMLCRDDLQGSGSGGNLFDQILNTTSNVTFNTIKAKNWTNVSITTAQITDFTTFNATYNNLLNQNCETGKVVNGTLANGTFVCVTPPSSTNNETDMVLSVNKTTNIELLINGTITNLGILNGFNSTFNGTYNSLINQNCPVGQVVNGTRANGTFICVTPSTATNSITLDIANITNFLYNYNQTLGAITDINSRFWNRTQTYNTTQIDGFAVTWNSTFNTTYNALINQDCPAGKVVNGTYLNGTFKCTTVSSSSADLTNVSFINQTETRLADQNISLGLRGWFFGRFFLTTVSNYLTYNGTTLTLADSTLNTDFNDTGRINGVNTTLGNILNVGCPAGNYTYDIQQNGTMLCRDDLTGGSSGNIFDQNLNKSSNVSFGNIVTFTNNTYNLGNTTTIWKSLFVGTINLVTLLSDAQISDTLTIGASSTVNDAALSANVNLLNRGDVITMNDTINNNTRLNFGSENQSQIFWDSPNNRLVIRVT